MGSPALSTFVNCSKFIERHVTLSRQSSSATLQPLDGCRTYQRAHRCSTSLAPAGIEVEIDVAEAAEVLMSICALGDRADYDTFDLGADWLRDRLETVPPDLLEAVDELGLGSLKVAAHLLGIVVETPKPRTFAAFLERLVATDPVELKLHLFGYYGSSFSHLAGPDVIERAARGDAEAREEFLRSLAEFADKHETYGELLELGGDEVKARLLDLLPRWYEHVFLPSEPEWREAAERDAEAKREQARKRSPEQLVELATRGYQYTPAPGIRTLAFFPSWWMRPWVILWEHQGAKIFCYPIAPPAEEAGDRFARRARARLQGARRRETATAAEAPERRAADAGPGGDRARPGQVDGAPPPRDPAACRLRLDPRRRRQGLQPPPPFRPARGRASCSPPTSARRGLPRRTRRARRRPSRRRGSTPSASRPRGRSPSARRAAGHAR